MELLQLRYFVKLAKIQNVTKTADKLLISAASLSSTIKRLENELGVPLFDRTGRNIVLNDAGRLFLQSTEKALNELDYISSNLKNLTSNDQTEYINIVYFNPRIWYEILEDFRQQYPSVVFNIEILKNPARIRNFSRDFYLGNKTDVSHYPEMFEYIELLPPEINVVVVNKEHHLASRRKINIKDLEREAVFSTTANYENENDTFTMRLLRDFDIHPKIIKGDAMLRYNLLMKNECVALTTNLGFLVNFFDSNDLVKIPIETKPEKARVQVAAWKKDIKIEGTRKVFLDYMKEACQNKYKRYLEGSI